MKKVSGTIPRRETYYANIKIPVSLRPRYGGKEVYRESLRTSDRRCCTDWGVIAVPLSPAKSELCMMSTRGDAMPDHHKPPCAEDHVDLCSDSAIFDACKNHERIRSLAPAAWLPPLDLGASGRHATEAGKQRRC